MDVCLGGHEFVKNCQTMYNPNPLIKVLTAFAYLLLQK